jgi:hypothetical protein
MGGACGTYGGQKRRIQNAGKEKLSEGDHTEYVGVYGRIILKQIFKKWKGVAWNELV